MAHPADMGPDGRCRQCGYKLSKIVRRRNGKLAFRRHLTKPDCPTKGRGEPLR